MATMKINLEKAEAATTSVPIADHSDRLQEMEASLRKFFERLDKPNEKFNASDAFDELLRYINNYDRILYSAIVTSYMLTTVAMTLRRILPEHCFQIWMP